VDRGVAVTAGRDLWIVLLRSDEAFFAGGKAVRLGEKDWRERRAFDDEGRKYIELVEPRSRVLVHVACLREACEEDKRDALAEEIASHARTTLPP